MESARQKIVTCYPLGQQDIDRIQTACPDCEVVVSDQKTVAENIFEADLFVGHAKVEIDWLRVVQTNRLKWIQSTAAGLDHCLTPAVVESDIIVSGCSGLFANQVAEQTLAMLFFGVRRLSIFVKAQANRQYIRRPTDTLQGKTIGIVGFGGNGRKIAESLKFATDQIIATDVFWEYDPPDYVTVLPPEKIKYLFASADVIIVTLPLNQSTRLLINDQLLSKLKPGSIFINVARGGVVDHAALEKRLRDGTLGFAGLDVIDPEPLPHDSPFWQLENVLITPHVGAQAFNRVPLTTELFCENFNRFRAGQRLVNEVDKQIGFPRPEHRLRIDAAGSINLPGA